MPSAIRQLLHELSWEGNATRYRGGGAGKENVLTAEVFQALDFLPRTQFLRAVLGSAGLECDAEKLVMTVLSGHLAMDQPPLRIQPDVLMESDDEFIVVEAKAIRRSAFQPEQLMRELLLTEEHWGSRRGALLLVLGAPPPIPVRGNGRLEIQDAINLGRRLISQRHAGVLENRRPTVDVRWTTWADVARVVRKASDSFTADDPSVSASIRRLSDSVSEAVQFHS